MLLDNLQFAARSMLHRPKRSWLTIIGILIGVAAVVSLISLGEGMQESINQEFEAFGYNVVMITAHADHRLGMGELAGTHNFKFDWTQLAHHVQGTEAVGGVLIQTLYVRAGKREGYLMNWGMDSGLMQAFPAYYKPVEGRIFNADERQAAVLGADMAKDLELSVGDKLTVETQEFEVVGVLEKRNDPDVNRSIFIPMQTMQDLMQEYEKISYVLIRTAQGADVKTIVTHVRAMAQEQRGKDDLNVHTTADMKDLMQSLVGILRAALSGIAAISLLVGGVGVMNTMYTAVLERTREIGVMKAVGARRRQVLGFFVLESGFMGLVGGLLGSLTGLGIAWGIKYLAPLFVPDTSIEVSFSPGLTLAVLALSFALGVLAGWLPARKAATLPPVEALRYE
ncbi:MAG TPA: ABC transporter permease [Candidatus Bipolaricaulota bacterium]